MNSEIFVRNVEIRCKQKGVPPTVACRESGAGKDFLTNLKKGQSPSLGKAQQLAQYLGCTVSDLLGEVPSPADISVPAMQFVKLYLSLPAELREQIAAAMLAAKEHLKNNSEIDYVVDPATGSGGFVTQALCTKDSTDDTLVLTAPNNEIVSDLSRKKQK